MTYRQCLDYLYGQLPMFHRIGPAAYKADLSNTIAIMHTLGNPEKGFRCIHVAGTNGKGSTSHMLASILQESGYRVGLFTSPHLLDFRERIRINGVLIEKKNVISFVKKYKLPFDNIRPSFFEWTAGLAFDHFRNSKVDIAIIETGLGGRLDSTNVLTPELSVITNVQWDHMNLLGNTLRKIAKEKAGIIKPRVPVIIGMRQKESTPIFQSAGKKSRAKIIFADNRFRAKPVIQSKTGAIKYFEIRRRGMAGLQHLKSALNGHYQQWNIPAVLTAAELLKEQGWNITKKSIRNGLLNVKQKTGIRGRWEIIGNHPLVVADTGHNKEGIQCVMDQIKSTPHQHLHMVIGAVNDKDIGAMLKLLPDKATYYFCRPDIPRGLDEKILLQEGLKNGLHGSSYRKVASAIRAALNNSDKKDMIFIGGSTFVVADALKYYSKRKK